MITIFTTPKPFIGQIGINQVNALYSWKALHPTVEVIIFGNDEGISEVAERLKLLHITQDFQTSEYGTPHIDSMFELAEKKGKYDTQMYINCDIILLEDFVSILKQIKTKPFLIVGQRWDLDLNETIDFYSADWRQQLREKVRLHGTLHDAGGIDYFVYSRGIWQNIPEMVVGRAGYDNWLIYYCRSRKIPVINATDVITAIHQNHDYSHLANGKDEAFIGVEAKRNMSLAGGEKYFLRISDADWKANSYGLTKNRLKRKNWYRFLEVYCLLSKSSILRKTWRAFAFMFGYYLKAKKTILLRVPRT